MREHFLQKITSQKAHQVAHKQAIPTITTVNERTLSTDYDYLRGTASGVTRGTPSCAVSRKVKSNLQFEGNKNLENIPNVRVQNWIQSHTKNQTS